MLHVISQQNGIALVSEGGRGNMEATSIATTSNRRGRLQRLLAEKATLSYYGESPC